MNPWAETTTVEDLLTLLEAECPVTIVIDALSKKQKQMTQEEKKRLVSDLEWIDEECQKALIVLKQGDV